MPPSPHDSLAELQARLGLEFSDLSLLTRALTHNSYAHETGTTSNGRLGILGESVILLFVVDYLYRRFPEADESQLEPLRARLVSNAMLAVVALELGLEADCLLAKGTRKQLKVMLEDGRVPERILGCLIQALVGAVYLDQGEEAARGFIVTHIITPKITGVVEQLDRG